MQEIHRNPHQYRKQIERTPQQAHIWQRSPKPTVREIDNNGPTKHDERTISIANPGCIRMAIGDADKFQMWTGNCKKQPFYAKRPRSPRTVSSHVQSKKKTRMGMVRYFRRTPSRERNARGESQSNHKTGRETSIRALRTRSTTPATRYAIRKREHPRMHIERQYG